MPTTKPTGPAVTTVGEPTGATGLGGATSDLVAQAWECRLARRPREIRFDSLVSTKAVSVTGRVCGSNCAHCGGHYLEDMLTADAALRLAGVGRPRRPGVDSPSAGGARSGERPARSWLVSGGCDPSGRVPLLGNEALLAELARSGPLNLHAGLVQTAEEARAIARHASAVSFDFVVDDQTIEEVYGFEGVRGQDFVRSFELLSAETRVMPHVLIGLAGGRVKGEVTALRELARLGARGVVLLVLIPTGGSLFEHTEPPPLEDAARVMAEARLLLPDVPVQLGCMRPKGAYRLALDVLAVRAGVDRIAVPTPAAVREAESLGLKAIWSKECCVFNRPGSGEAAAGPARAGEGS